MREKVKLELHMNNGETIQVEVNRDDIETTSNVLEVRVNGRLEYLVNMTNMAYARFCHE